MSRQKSEHSILTVDDCEIIISLTQILLESEGYKLHSANSASVAMDLIKQQHFDLILLDIEMPDMSGLELLQELHRQDLLQNTKVVMLSGNADDEHVKQCLALGATSYITKPFDHESMKNTIREVMQDS